MILAKNTEIFTPQSLGELLSLYFEHTEALLFAGGIECMKQRRFPAEIIDLGQVPELKRISRSERHIDIGATLPIAHILSIGRHVIPKVFYDALNSITAPAIKNMATLGGSLGSASTHSDPIVVLYALEARVEVKSLSNTRWLPIATLIRNPGETSIESGEILTRVRIPLNPWSVEIFRNVAARGLPFLSTLTFCGLASISKGVIQDVRLSFGSINPTVIRDRNLEAPLLGQNLPLQEREIKLVVSRLSEILAPIESSYTTKAYRKETAYRMTRWFLDGLLRFLT